MSSWLESGLLAVTLLASLGDERAGKTVGAQLGGPWGKRAWGVPVPKG